MPKVSRTLVFFVEQFEEFLVGQADDGVGGGFQPLQAGVRLAPAAFALEFEGHGGHREDQRAAFAGHAGQDGRRAGARAAAQAGEDENDVRPGAEGGQLRRVVLGGGAALFGIAAGAKPACTLLAEDPFAVEGRGGEGLGVCVEEQKLNVVQLGLRDEAGGVATGAANAADFDAEFLLQGGFAGGFRGRAGVGFKGGGHARF